MLPGQALPMALPGGQFNSMVGSKVPYLPAAGGRAAPAFGSRGFPGIELQDTSGPSVEGSGPINYFVEVQVDKEPKQNDIVFVMPNRGSGMLYNMNGLRMMRLMSVSDLCLSLSPHSKYDGVGKKFEYVKADRYGFRVPFNLQTTRQGRVALGPGIDAANALLGTVVAEVEHVQMKTREDHGQADCISSG